ncbi:cupin domain-containing protein [Paraburkholderia hospita]|uniref:cupin domain-containing protein n=1 Tax=Paraburkholderia hospita TaxID=169430 RepID=UPI003ECEC877
MSKHVQDKLNQTAHLRVVTITHADGKSGLHADTAPPRVNDYQTIDGMRTSILWATEPETELARAVSDPVRELSSLHPRPGGSVFMTLTLPPDSVTASPAFDPVAAANEHARLAPGLAENFEPDAPGFHTTDTIDYVVVLQGNIWLATDTGEVKLGPGDCVIQNGTRHAWRNRGDIAATVAVVLMGMCRSIPK